MTDDEVLALTDDENARAVILLHFDRPYPMRGIRPVQHKIHYCYSLHTQMRRLRAGEGPKLLKAIAKLGIGWQVVRVWLGATGYDKETFQARHPTRLCPICQPHLAVPS